MARKRTEAAPKSVETITHVDDTRTNIPTAEYQAVLRDSDRASIRVAYERRNRDLDPQLVWRGKDEQDWSDLVVHAPPLYIQEKVHPKVLIDDLVRQSKKGPSDDAEQLDLFADFNRLPEGADKTEFYEHEQGWTNRMILGDSLQVMASLAEREGLRGKVQCIYFDPPYGIKFNSNFQWSTTDKSGSTNDGMAKITREPEQVRAFRDTWRDGVHSYLSFLRDRLAVARELLSDSGSIFVQIGDENVHRVRAVLDEVFGDANFLSLITFVKTGGLTQDYIKNKCDYILWYARDRRSTRSFAFLLPKEAGGEGASKYTGVELPTTERMTRKQAERRFGGDLPEETRSFRLATTTSEANAVSDIRLDRGEFSGRWKTTEDGMRRLERADRLVPSKKILNYVRYIEDFPAQELSNVWDDIGGIQSRLDPKVFVVQTATEAVKRCLLLASAPGDLVLDPTCGSGTTAYVAEQWGRRWITIDTSRVALALARARVMGARYQYYLLTDSEAGQVRESALTGTPPRDRTGLHGSLRHGFVCERAPHITLGSIARNAEIDVIYEKWEARLNPLTDALNRAMAAEWREWEVPRVAEPSWNQGARELHEKWWAARIKRQRDIDASNIRHAETEFFFDRPFEDDTKVRVAGPFTVESLSPHRVLGVDENDELIDPLQSDALDADAEQTFAETILENLRAAGVQQAHKDDRISFTSLVPWPGDLVCAEGRYLEGETERRAAIFIGPEFGTVLRSDLVQAAREAGDAGFDVVIACAFGYEAHATELTKLGSIPVLKARMNADLHMADDLKATGKGNLFVVFGEPDIELLDAGDGKVQVKLNGVDVFDPTTGEVRSDSADGIACWFIDTEYNEESFFVRHAYFLGADDPYRALKTTLKAEIDEDAWATLHSDVSRPFDKPETGRIAVKVINHLGDEVMKVFRVA